MQPIVTGLPTLIGACVAVGSGVDVFVDVGVGAVFVTEGVASVSLAQAESAVVSAATRAKLTRAREAKEGMQIF
ncbi:hypothetical protein GCM10027413_23230 [Conyzicola nivalis]|uniref:Uncharacterized protein n=1 Tax=Conyzicola nivalis TaxID=1477021 RepID=A0A916SDB5_9MICO|nr:hypothetical protein GCM10010979_03390 [Conyzicola nivalis]